MRVERRNVFVLIASIMPLVYLRFLPLFFALSASYSMFVPLHSVVDSGFASCDHHHSVTPLPEHIGVGGSIALSAAILFASLFDCSPGFRFSK